MGPKYPKVTPLAKVYRRRKKVSLFQRKKEGRKNLILSESNPNIMSVSLSGPDWTTILQSEPKLIVIFYLLIKELIKNTIKTTNYILFLNF